MKEIKSINEQVNIKENKTPQIVNKSVFERSVEFVMNNEGFSETCEYDNLQNSRGFGTKCIIIGSKITRKEAIKQKLKHIEGNYKRVISLNSNLTENEIIGLVSFFYNTGNYNKTVSYLKKGDMNSVKYIMSQYIMKNTIYEKGLRKRRGKEISVIEGTYLF